MKIRLIIALLAVSGIIASTADITFNASAQGDTYAIRNAHIVPVTSAPIERGTVVITGGKIAAVGASVAVPAGAKIIDASGLSIYPGLIDAGTTVGLTEIGSVAGSVDTSEIGDNNADIHVDVALLPDSTHIPVARVNGITTVLTEPRGGTIAGRSSLVDLDGWVPKEMVLKPDVAMHINWPGSTAPGGGEFGGRQRRTTPEARREQERQIDNLKQIIRDARAYADAKDARAKDPSLPRRNVDLKFEALIPVVRGNMPVIIQAGDEQDIRGAIAFADEMKIKMILSGGIQAYKVADQLKAKNIPVIVGPVLRLPVNEDDPYDMAFANASVLAKAGVKIAFQTLDSAHVRDLPYHAGMAAAFGLPKEEALKAVTINAAEILGASDLIGSIEKGKVANLIVTDGDPLEVLTHVKYLFINGHQLPLTSKHTELYEKYKARP